MNAKQAAGEKAVEFVKNGMNVGLGTGSTVYWTILKLAEMVKQGLQIQGIPTSKQTEELAKEHGIPLVSFSDVEILDVTIDGADEFDPQLNLIKGGGGALLREKLVAVNSRQLIIVADGSKQVEALGAFKLPVEIVPFAWETTRRRIEELGGVPVLRKKEDQTYITDNGNYILDCDFGAITDPEGLNQKLKQMTGVVETGLFVGLADTVILAAESGVQVISK